jgi:hypothetical protein
VERHEWALQAQTRRSAAAWREQMLKVLFVELRRLVVTYHGAQQFLRSHHIEECGLAADLRWPLAFDTVFDLEPLIAEIESAIDIWAQARLDNLAALYRGRKGRAA